MRKQDAPAENRARVVLLENGWQLGEGYGSAAVLVAERGERVLYGDWVDLLRRALHAPERQPGAREGRARRAEA